MTIADESFNEFKKNLKDELIKKTKEMLNFSKENLSYKNCPFFVAAVIVGTLEILLSNMLEVISSKSLIQMETPKQIESLLIPMAELISNLNNFTGTILPIVVMSQYMEDNSNANETIH